MNFKNKTITYYGQLGTIYSEVVENFPDWGLVNGDWQKPFPNDKNDNLAYGLIELLFQSYRCPDAFRGEDIIRVKVEDCDEN